jgi:formylglycine-generating enzyme required for sulfatase activity
MVLSPARGGDKARVPQVTLSANATTYQFAAGWNLISVNLELDVASKTLLQNRGAVVLDANSMAYAIGGHVAVSQACWIFCQAEGETLTLFGDPPENFDFFASLQPGWNFAGPLTDRTLSGDGIVAWGWDGQRFRQTDNLVAGHGYWIYLSDDYVKPPAEDTYLVVDLSAGSYADSYQVSYLSTPPEDGWTDEYKYTKMVLRKIPAGTFMMGSPEEELGRYGHRETQHQVTLTRDFYVGIFEVTQSQWRSVKGGYPSYFKNGTYGAFRPVEQISYNDIRGAGSAWPANNEVDSNSFVRHLRARTGLDFDLPTEAQWEYACRANTTTALNSGLNLTAAEEECRNMNKVGRYYWNGDLEQPDWDANTSSGTNRVGSYKANQWGLYDMHGNVYEWCLDWVYKYPTEAVTDPTGNADGEKRIVRGGSWENYARECRSAYYNIVKPSERYRFLGFRIVVPVPWSLPPYTTYF